MSVSRYLVDIPQKWACQAAQELLQRSLSDHSRSMPFPTQVVAWQGERTHCKGRMANSLEMRNRHPDFPPGWMRALWCIMQMFRMSWFPAWLYNYLRKLWHTPACAVNCCISLVSRHFWDTDSCQLRWLCLPWCVLSFLLGDTYNFNSDLFLF